MQIGDIMQSQKSFAQGNCLLSPSPELDQAYGAKQQCGQPQCGAWTP